MNYQYLLKDTASQQFNNLDTVFIDTVINDPVI